MDGQVAIVTGGAMGIGREFVEVLLSRKFKVCIADINETKGPETVLELRKNYPGCDVMFEHCDVSNDQQLEGAFKITLATFGRLDLLINNAGLLHESKQKLMLAVNLGATIQGTMIALGVMSKTSGGPGGLIVNTASIAALRRSKIFPVYCATKYGVMGFTRSIGATSLEEHGVRINCICPADTDTDMLSSVAEDTGVIYGGKEKHDEFCNGLSNLELMSPKKIAACLNPLLDDVTLSGAVKLSSIEHPQAVLRLPTSVADVHSMYVQK